METAPCFDAPPPARGTVAHQRPGSLRRPRPDRAAARSAVWIWRRLRSASLRDRAAAVRAATESPEMLAQPALRATLRRELVLAIETDRAEAAAAPAGWLRAASPAREYLEALSRFEAVARDARALPLLAFADAPAVYSLLAFGRAAIPHILGILAKPAPAGYSDDYKLKVFEMLRRIAHEERLGLEDLAQVAGAALGVVRARETTVEFAREALLLAEEADLDEFDTHIEALATDDDAIRALGILVPSEVALVRETARGILSRRAVK